MPGAARGHATTGLLLGLASQVIGKVRYSHGDAPPAGKVPPSHGLPFLSFLFPPFPIWSRRGATFRPRDGCVPGWQMLGVAVINGGAAFLYWHRESVSAGKGEAVSPSKPESGEHPEHEERLAKTISAAEEKVAEEMEKAVAFERADMS